ncbi:MAG: penicillin-binding transpeptidase domain-containing protein, partial [Bradymonadaceae bacterium]
SVLPDDWKKAGLDIDKAERIGDRLVQTLPSGLQVELTIDPAIQAHLEKTLADYSVPHGSVVLVEPETGRVLAMVSRTDHKPRMPALARHAAAPAASTFKVVTAAALLESTGVDAQTTTCYHGGASHLSKSNIVGSSHDDRCEDLGDALGWSINSIIAKLAHKHLDREDLQVWAKRFGYNTEIPFELPVEQSSAEIVKDPIERARTAAGFWHTYLSPLHGALIGAAVQNGGLMMRPSIIEEVRADDGEVLKRFEPKVLRRVMSSETADILGDLLENTTTKGTADKYFAHRGAFPNDVTAAGKTGTLANDDPYMSFTWFIGFGENEHVADRAAAVGGLICNTPKWRIKGPWAASEGLRKYFQVQQRRAQAESDEKLAASEQ